MPINDQEIDELEDATKKSNRSKAIDHLKENSDQWFYINELSEKAELARSTVLEAVNQNPDVIKEKYKKKDGRKHRYVTYSKED